MNYQEARKEAKRLYEEKLKELHVQNKIAQKIKPALPDGWEINFSALISCFDISKGKFEDVYNSKKEKVYPGEFKLVCGIVEKALSEYEENPKLKRKARVSEGNQIYHLSAERYIHCPKEKVTFGVRVKLYNPGVMPNCKIEWKETIQREAVVSDECLGIG